MSARIKLYKSASRVSDGHPYYEPAIDRLRFEANDKKCSTMGMTDNLTLVYNEKFVDSLKPEVLDELTIHELLHFIMNHHARYLMNKYHDTVDGRTHNVAMDLEINSHLHLPKDTYCVPGEGTFLKYPKGLSYEAYMDMIMSDDNIKKIPMPSGMKGIEEKDITGNDDVDKSGSASNESKIEDMTNKSSTLRDKCEESKAKADRENQGDGSFINPNTYKIRKKPYDWKKVLKSVVETTANDLKRGFDYRTFRIPNRRITETEDGVILPSYQSYDKTLKLIVGMDVSGSMYRYHESIYSLLKSIGDRLDINYDITILECDTKVINVIHNFDLSANEVKSSDGGGTDMSAITKYIADNQNSKETDIFRDFQKCIIITDGYTPWDNDLFKNKTVVITNNPDHYRGPYQMFAAKFD